MNYRHIYHAGNFADVFKHAILSLIVSYLARKDKPFCVLDTHAGQGVYDLMSEQAQKTGEFRDGVGRLLAEPHLPASLAPYMDVIRKLNADGDLRRYPGSPLLARSLMRPGDRLVAAELHPEDAQGLAELFRHDRQAITQCMDGYTAIKAFLPPPERRGLILVDPPFEERDEVERLTESLTAAHRRFATGVYALWYPIKDRAPIAACHDALEASGVRALLAVELLIRPDTDPRRLNGCGLVIVNPPWTLPAELAELLPTLVRLLAREPGAGFRCDWLVEE